MTAEFNCRWFVFVACQKNTLNDTSGLCSANQWSVNTFELCSVLIILLRGETTGTNPNDGNLSKACDLTL